MHRLGRDEIDTLLRAMGYGFLGLAEDDTPYVIPMSFGYDGAQLYFQMNSAGRKFTFLTDGGPAAFAVLALDEATGVSRSILVEGPIEWVPDDEVEDAYRALAENASFGTELSPWSTSLEEAEPAFLALRADSVSGRVFGDESG